ncbi:MAG: DNA polymerase III subunit delta' [Proteobacteria bacterium]|nr:DNA polymerase III subunit delta' [Pseudomonadota bacterium]
MADAPTYENPHDPRLTAELLGHEKAQRQLLEAHTAGRLHHAWLLTGPRGIGKATLAYRFARYLLTKGSEGQGADARPGLFGEALEGTTGEAMALQPDHPVFRRVAAGGHGNLRILQRSVDEKTGKMRQEITVGDVRKLHRFFASTAAEEGWRIVIVDAADDMNRNAANALLKILEEPPEKSILLLVAHRPGVLPATIRSRCQALALSPLTEEQVVGVVSARLPELSGEDHLALARLGAGAPGRALALAGEGGLDLYRRMIGVMENLPDLKTADSHALADELAGRGAEQRYSLLVDLVLYWVGGLVRAGARGAAMPEITGGEQALAARLTASVAVERWLAVWEKMGETVERAERQKLDRKQTVLALLGQLQGAFSAS